MCFNSTPKVVTALQLKEITMKSVFVGFADEADVFAQFTVNEEEQKDVEFLFAQYDQECYEGSAFVLFARKGKLYEVNGSHCSCYGLESQWSPEETSLDALRKRSWWSVSAPLADLEASIKRWQQREYARKRRQGK